ncbi:UDP-xylose and UDP-N-acetylglucosamine transporter, partial [Eumeta japonica]
MLVYWYAKNRPPKINRVIGSVLITVGVCMATYSGATIAEQKEGVFLYWCMGVAILIVNLFLGAFTGLQQERIYSIYGKHPEEVLFYTNALALPFFLFTYREIRDAALGSSWAVWSLIVISVIPQSICTQAVHELATKENTVTVTFILT